MRPSLFQWPTHADIDPETFAGRRNCFAAAGRHRLRESPCHGADHARPVIRSKFHRMTLDMYIRRVSEHRFQIFNMSLQSLGLAFVWLVDNRCCGHDSP